jgi:threonylcarbamoyladenosine tRNA methylthiotransferase MtaB
MDFFVYTFGCKTNHCDSEEIINYLSSNGKNKFTNLQEADIVIINSCTVTSEAERQCRQYIRRILRNYPHKKVILTGCYLRRDKENIKNLFPNIVLIDIKERDEFRKYFDLLENSKPSKNNVNEENTSSDCQLYYIHTHTRGFIKIEEGCDNFCSYCIIPFVRGNKIYSKPFPEVIKEVKEMINRGVKEIVLTGIRLGKYLSEEDGKKITLSDLVEEILSLNTDTNHEYRVRLSSIECTDIDDKLLTLMSYKPTSLCRYLHIPLQSGDNKILALMRRKYTTEIYKEKINYIRSKVDGIGIYTDVIVGFPGEDDEAFENTRKFIEEISFSGLHVFPYSMRPYTYAASLNNHVSPKTKDERVKILLQLDKILRKNFISQFINTTLYVLFERKEKNGFLSGYTDNYIRVNAQKGTMVNNTEVECGKMLPIKLTYSHVNNGK